MKKYKKVVVAEQNMGQFAGYLRMKVTVSFLISSTK